MSVGKRHSTDEPLTEHDVAARLDAAVLRTLRIMVDARRLGMRDDVVSSRYFSGAAFELAAEFETWGIKPRKRAGGDGA